MKISMETLETDAMKYAKSLGLKPVGAAANTYKGKICDVTVIVSGSFKQVFKYLKTSHLTLAKTPLGSIFYDRTCKAAYRCENIVMVEAIAQWPDRTSISLSVIDKDTKDQLRWSKK